MTLTGGRANYAASSGPSPSLPVTVNGSMTSSRGRSTTRFRRIASELRAQFKPCWICGQPIDYNAEPGTPNSFQADHIKPLADHPELAEEPTNLAASHMRCNGQRGRQAPPPAIGKTSRQW